MTALPHRENGSIPKLRARAYTVPEEAGIYRWLDAEGVVLYVGKAKNLRSRLRSYFGKDPGGPWKQSLMRQVADLDCTVTGSELEALVLEMNLIKEHRPKYNVLMKDDKNYAYARISVREPYPRVSIVRRMVSDGAKYFGPFQTAYEVEKLLNLLHLLYPWKACKASLDALNTIAEKAVPHLPHLHACTAYHIGQCIGLCTGSVTRDQYRASIDEILRFFRGQREPALECLRALMRWTAAEKKFERAAELRDAMKIFEGGRELQRVSDPSQGDADIIGVAVLSGRAQVVVLLQRSGKIIGERSFALAGHPVSVAEVLEQFLPQYMQAVSDLPPLLLVPEQIESVSLLEQFSSAAGRRTEIRVPERGKKSGLLELAMKNALAKAKQSEAKWEADERNTQGALVELASALGLPSPPKRIEGYDISHLGGTETLGSMVVFRNGKPAPDHYRSFAVRTLKLGSVDDYRALREVLMRRFKHLELDRDLHAFSWKKLSKGEKESFIAANPQKTSMPRKWHHDVYSVMYERRTLCTADVFRLQGGSFAIGTLLLADADRDLLHSACDVLEDHLRKQELFLEVDPEQRDLLALHGFFLASESLRKLPASLRKSLPKSAHLFHRLPSPKAKDISFTSIPDLLVIDGGKGQLGVARKVLKAMELDIPVIALAKEHEEVFMFHKGRIVSINEMSEGAGLAGFTPGGLHTGKGEFVRGKPNGFPLTQGKFLLMRLRDEAHRFANKGREGRGLKRAVQSALRDIPGIGPEIERALFRAFGSMEGVRTASEEELRNVVGASQADVVLRHLSAYEEEK